MPDNSPCAKKVTKSGRVRILDEAERLFRTRGYHCVTMRDIASEVGIRQASLYYHFPSKEELFVAVTERMFEIHRTGLQQVIHNESDLRSQLHAAAFWFLSQPPIHFLSMVHTDMPLLGEENVNKLSAGFQQCVFEQIRQVFAQAQERGEIRNTRPEILAGLFLSFIESIPYVTTRPGTEESEVIVNEVISVLLDGLKL